MTASTDPLVRASLRGCGYCGIRRRWSWRLLRGRLCDWCYSSMRHEHVASPGFRSRIGKVEAAPDEDPDIAGARFKCGRPDTPCGCERFRQWQDA